MTQKTNDWEAIPVSYSELVSVNDPDIHTSLTIQNNSGGWFYEVWAESGNKCFGLYIG